LTCIGLTLGTPIALTTSRLAGSLLYGVSASDPLVFVVVPAAILLVAVFACYIPARRATRLDPLTALRHD
jgi:ABC-type antimicrobial peptide transport system permease subunit